MTFKSSTRGIGRMRFHLPPYRIRRRFLARGGFFEANDLRPSLGVQRC